MRTIYRSAVTGKMVSKKYAEANPDTTFVQKIPQKAATGETMEKFTALLTGRYKGWHIVDFHTHPVMTPGAGQPFIVTIESPDDGTDKPKKTVSLTVGNVVEGQISEG